MSLWQTGLAVSQIDIRLLLFVERKQSSFVRAYCYYVFFFFFFLPHHNNKRFWATVHTSSGQYSIDWCYVGSPSSLFTRENFKSTSMSKRQISYLYSNIFRFQLFFRVNFKFQRRIVTLPVTVQVYCVNSYHVGMTSYVASLKN